MKTITGQFQIKDWQETTQSENQSGTKRSLANVKLAYSGDLTGTSELQYLLHYQADGSAEFLGFETIDAGENGQINLRHLGTFVSGMATSQFEVIFSSMNDSLIGKKGQFTSGENGMATYMIGHDE